MAPVSVMIGEAGRLDTCCSWADRRSGPIVTSLPGTPLHTHDKAMRRINADAIPAARHQPDDDARGAKNERDGTPNPAASLPTPG
jgi:hypothetical protein